MTEMFHVEHRFRLEAKRSFDREKVREIFSAAGLTLSDQQLARFELYHSKLLKWNSRANLISKRDETRIIERHFLESARLALLSEIRTQHGFLDLGTGGGFPGVPLKIVLPNISMVLLDSKRWKQLFLKSLSNALKLDAVEIACGRAETLKLETHLKGKFDAVLCRAVGSLQELYALARPFMKKEALLVSIKGSQYQNEIDDLGHHGVDVWHKPLSDSSTLTQHAVFVRAHCE